MNRSPLAQAKSLAQADRFDEATDLCAKLLADGTEPPNEVLRTRAYVYALSGNYAKASEDREAILERGGDVSLRDFYHAADAALKARDVDRAADRFLQTIKRGNEEGDEWFHSAAMFYLAFLEMERENFDQALEYVSRVKKLDRECQLPIPGVGIVSVGQLEGEIAKRRH